MLGLMTNEPVTCSSVCPSGGAFATMSVPMMPFAPDRLSITNDCPSPTATSFATMRAMASAVPPAGKGATSRIGRAGYVSACACNAQHSTGNTSSLRNMITPLALQPRKVAALLLFHADFTRDPRIRLDFGLEERPRFIRRVRKRLVAARFEDGFHFRLVHRL